MTSSHLAARLALLLRVDVDGRLVDTCECVVPWIVSKRVRKLCQYAFVGFELIHCS